MLQQVTLIFCTYLSSVVSFPLKNCNIDNKEILFVIDCRGEVREQINFINQTVDYLRYNRNWTSLNVSYMTSADGDQTNFDVLTANISEKVSEIENQCNGTISVDDLFLLTKQTIVPKHSNLRINFIYLNIHLMEEDIFRAVDREISDDIIYGVARNIKNDFHRTIRSKNLCSDVIQIWISKVFTTFINNFILQINAVIRVDLINDIAKKVSEYPSTKRHLRHVIFRRIGLQIANYYKTDNDFFVMIAKKLINAYIYIIARKYSDNFIRMIIEKQHKEVENFRFFYIKYLKKLSFEISNKNLRWDENDLHFNKDESYFLYKCALRQYKPIEDIELPRTDEGNKVLNIYLHYTTSFKNLNIFSLYPEFCDLKCIDTNLTFVSQNFQESFYHVDYRDRVSHNEGVKYCKEQFNSYLLSVETIDELIYLMSKLLETNLLSLNVSDSFNIHLGLVVKQKEPLFWSSGNIFTFVNELDNYNSTQCMYYKYTANANGTLSFIDNKSIKKYLHVIDCDQSLKETFILCECHHDRQLDEDFLNKPMNKLYTSGFVFKGDIVSFFKNYAEDINERKTINCYQFSKSRYKKKYYLCQETTSTLTYEKEMLLQESFNNTYKFDCLNFYTMKIKNGRNQSAGMSESNCYKEDIGYTLKEISSTEIQNVTCNTYKSVCPKCLKLKDECRDNSHLQNCEKFQCPVDFVKCPHSYCIPLAMVDDTDPLCPLGQEKAIFKQTGSNCSASITLKFYQICIPRNYIYHLRKYFNASGHYPCDNKCPSNYGCLFHNSQDEISGLYKYNIQLYRISNLLLPKQKQKFSLPYQQVIEISIPGCKIQNVDKALEHWNTEETVILDLSNNDISDSNYISFITSMTNLLYLNLSYNRQLSINEKFVFPCSLEVVYLSHTNVNSLPFNCFENLTRLEFLDLSFTKIHKFENIGIPENFQLDILDMQGLVMTEINVDFFKGLRVKDHLYTSDFKLCCPQILGDKITQRKCHAPEDAISSCENVVRDKLKRILIWVVGLMTIVGNGIVLIYRFVWSREKIFQTAYGLFVTGLAVSDLLMGVYLMIIAAVDIIYDDVYVVYDASWRSSNLCHFSGFLSTLSSETSTFLIGLITLDRYISISYPFSTHRISKNLKWKGFISTWAVGFILALIPIIVPGWQIYSSNGLCLALPLSTTGFVKLPGWEFSLAVYVILNFVLFLLIALGQVGIFVNVIKKSNLPSMRHCSERKTQDMNIAKKLAFVAVSDFLCWFPIGVMGILSLVGQEFDKETYAWMAVFVLPVNSALNPMIYTIPVIINKLKLKPTFGK